MNVRPDQLADAILEELEAYSDEVTEGVKTAVKAVGRETVRDIQAHSPELTGSYRRGWKAKIVHESSTDIRVVVHNRTDYQIAHLLENGHAKRNGGRVEGRPHVGPAADRAAKKLQKKVKVVVRG